MTDTLLPRWSVADVHESFTSRSFTDAMERTGANVARLEAQFEEFNIRAGKPHKPSAQEGETADKIIVAMNETIKESEILGSYVYATVSTNTREETAQGLLSELEVIDSRLAPLLARFADWIATLGADELAKVSEVAREHLATSKITGARRTSDDRNRRGLLCRTLDDWFIRMVTTTRRHNIAALSRNSSTRRHQNFADHCNSRHVDTLRLARTQSRLRRRNACMANSCHTVRRGDEFDQGRSQRS